MIKTIELHNFQRHEHLTIRPAECVTVIVGVTHSGKSAVMRAINWVVFNKPAGGSFIRHGAETASVMIETEKGKVTRTRSTKGRNEYVIDLVDGGSHIFTGFGQNVPSPISDFFELEEINFQPQMSLPFLICSSGGEISRKLNQIANLDKIDSTLSELGRISRTTTSSLTAARGRMETALSAAKALGWVESAEQKLDEISALSTEAEELRTRCTHIEAALALVKKASQEDIKGRQKHIETLAAALHRGSQLLTENGDYDRLVTTYNTIFDAVERCQTAQTALEAATALEQKALKEYQAALPAFCPLCGGPMESDHALHTHS